MPALLLAWVLKYASAETVKAVVGFIFSPAGAIVCIGLAFGGGDLWGRHKANVYWRAEMVRQREAAKAVDVKAAEQAARQARADAEAANKRATQDEERIKRYDDKLRDKADDTGCTLDDSDVTELGGVRSQ